METVLNTDSLNEKNSNEFNDDEHELFNPVLASIRLDKLADYASSIRKTLDHHSANFSAVIVGSPIFGSYHILYPIEFLDKVRWLLKVPINGTRDKFCDLDARSIRSEASTMRYLRKITTIPIPDVITFSSSCDNELNCPFILMSYIDGKPLYDIWFDRTQPNDVIEARRTKSLQGVAAAMVQLGQVSFEQAGSLFTSELNGDIDANSLEIWPLRLVNNIAMLERMKDDDYDDLPIYLEAGPFRDFQAYFTALLDYREKSPTTDFTRGQLILLRILLDWIPEPKLRDECKPFVLAHPDLDIQNVLVAEDGTLQGIIDWDGVCSVPRPVGNERFPSWLTRDWDPAMYGWNEDMERGVEPVGVWEDSPEILRKYRSIYVGFMQSFARSNNNPLFGLTRNSIIYENLLIAANDPLCTFGILQKVFGEIQNHVRTDVLQSESSDEEGLEEFDLHNISWALSENRLSECHLNLLKQGFHLLLNGEEVL
ncbi:uncharacterized protein BHQ10_006482 [Talaromyces amestolkiae]|uniref:Aminoglycoside phosphotransferase domain-containing protein n=1 Tax=Talaromyces amestolkiae TaxID=1196081 RepID=A0A364L3T0_TALAM|nr:uncharacterized protein BHQ10_006482 [Talaromyces amestolkiae]RAO70470.1 hypothetical protein BHQ10_006482 [Talaromyces amestolkiae]